MILKNKKIKMKGFTLVELLAVIVILAIILVIAVPKIMSVIEDAKKATLESTVKMIATEAEKAKAFIDSIHEMNNKLEIPRKIEELQKKDITELAGRAVKEGNPTYPVPVIWEKSDFYNLIGKML